MSNTCSDNNMLQINHTLRTIEYLAMYRMQIECTMRIIENNYSVIHVFLKDMVELLCIPLVTTSFNQLNLGTKPSKYGKRVVIIS